MSRLVRTVRKQIPLQAVALSADISDRNRPWFRSLVESVAAGAVGCTPIPFNQQRLAMHTL